MQTPHLPPDRTDHDTRNILPARFAACAIFADYEVGVHAHPQTDFPSGLDALQL